LNIRNLTKYNILKVQEIKRYIIAMKEHPFIPKYLPKRPINSALHNGKKKMTEKNVCGQKHRV